MVSPTMDCTSDLSVTPLSKPHHIGIPILFQLPQNSTDYEILPVQAEAAASSTQEGLPKLHQIKSPM